MGAGVPKTVALRKESVDRNAVDSARRAHYYRSLSARRAWIEITCIALKKYLVMSLSARRAWIEMWVLRKVPILGIVALRKESVDRNVLYH